MPRRDPGRENGREGKKARRRPGRGHSEKRPPKAAGRSPAKKPSNHHPRAPAHRESQPGPFGGPHSNRASSQDVPLGRHETTRGSRAKPASDLASSLPAGQPASPVASRAACDGTQARQPSSSPSLARLCRRRPRRARRESSTPALLRRGCILEHATAPGLVASADTRLALASPARLSMHARLVPSRRRWLIACCSPAAASPLAPLFPSFPLPPSHPAFINMDKEKLARLQAQSARLGQQCSLFALALSSANRLTIGALFFSPPLCHLPLLAVPLRPSCRWQGNPPPQGR